MSCTRALKDLAVVRLILNRLRRMCVSLIFLKVNPSILKPSSQQAKSAKGTLSSLHYATQVVPMC